METPKTNPSDQEKDNNHSLIPEPSPHFAGKNESNAPNHAEQTSLEHNEPNNPVPNIAGENRSIPPKPLPLMPSEERTWAMLAHLSILLNLVTGFLGAVAAIIIYFAYKDRSRLVAYHAMQSFIFQAITWWGAGILAAIFIGLGSAFAFLIIPILCLIPGFLFLLVTPVSLVYAVIGGVKVNNGEDFRYWQVGDWVREILEPKPIQ